MLGHYYMRADTTEYPNSLYIIFWFVQGCVCILVDSNNVNMAM